VVRAAAGLLASWACAALATATESPTTEHVVTLAGLFPPNQVAALAKTLPADREVTFRVRAPSGAAASGVLVYISPTDSGELPESWTRVLDEKHLLWIAADDYGNSVRQVQEVRHIQAGIATGRSSLGSAQRSLGMMGVQPGRPGSWS